MCICSENRCAVPSSQCETALYEYEFPQNGEDRECVERDALRTMLAANDESSFCPAEIKKPAICGKTSSVTCANHELCLCGAAEGSVDRSYTCVVPDAECPITGLALAFDNRCVVGTATAADLIFIHAGELCPGYDLETFLPDAGTSTSGDEETGD
jgi:hypothetical protein